MLLLSPDGLSSEADRTPKNEKEPSNQYQTATFASQAQLRKRAQHELQLQQITLQMSSRTSDKCSIHKKRHCEANPTPYG